MNTNHSIQLTSAEMGKLWATYNGNTMGICVLSYFLNHADDPEIKQVLKYALGLSKTYEKTIKDLFIEAGFPVPAGFTDADVDLKAPRLYDDEFYLHYLMYLGKAGISIYSAAIPLVTNKRVRDFFVQGLSDTVKLVTDVSDILKLKGKLANAPIIPAPDSIDFVERQDFLHGYIGDIRPLHGLEVAHLFGNLHNDTTSKALIIGFKQVARHKDVKKYLERGEKINQKHISILSGKLTNDHLPSPPLLDHLVTTSTTPPFSDKLMVFHKIDMFSMKIREYTNGASLDGRKDIGVMYAKCLLDVSLYVEDGANIMISHGWMEQPPETPDRDNLSQEN